MTRYPKSGKGKKWTIKELDAIGADWKGDTLNDGDGLSGDVRLAGKVSIHFRYAFKWQGKLAWHYCGAYPTTDMVTIRDARDKARDLIKAGIDPRANKVAVKIGAQAAIVEVIRADEQKRTEALTFNDLYAVWIKDGVNRSDGNKYLMQSLGKHAIPALGNIELRHLTENHLRDVYRAIIAAGKTPTAVELSKDIGQMLRWAEKRKPWRALLIDGNPAELVDIKQLVPNDYTKERKRQLSLEEIVKLKMVFDEMAKCYADASQKYGTERPLKKEAQIALWLCLGTICRIGELLMTEWKHVNLEQRTWFIPAANTKGERGQKRDQLVYLSDFTLNQFKQLHALTGDGDWAFPARYKEGHICEKTVSKQVGDRQVKFKQRSRKLQCRVENNSLVTGDVEWTPHDLRRTGATLMQKLKVSREVVNLCQNHVIGSKVDRVYLLDDYADEKREAWITLGNRIEAILGANNVVQIKAA
ncbi:MAG: tyrosine-type recombinase/integrase [Methylotenera sp.]|uniref:tyrosine-type recombinase/integrase n=1 Tax=Methylotenera sp. TaxID=2051956 RepID=UPI00248A40E7|nr:site-specific integrase [Methylotenera sp.]MDI1310073.1 tyrosine-type recombinase/integrase [Methylotenera sp.]